MNFTWVAPTLPQLDQLQHDTLVIAHFGDERPLQGVGGLLDWRLNGKLSELILDGRITGAWGEQLLYPQGKRVGFSKVLYFGLGDRSKFSSTRFKEITNRMLRTLMRIQVSSFATVLPGQRALKLVPRQLIELWLGELEKVFLADDFNDREYEICFLEPEAVRTEIIDPLQGFARAHSPDGRGRRNR